jgi:hypothetical protein
LELAEDRYPHFAVVIKETAGTLFYYEIKSDFTSRSSSVPLVRSGSVVRPGEFKVAEKQVATDGAVFFRHDLYGFSYEKWSGAPLQRIEWDCPEGLSGRF